MDALSARNTRWRLQFGPCLFSSSSSSLQQRGFATNPTHPIMRSSVIRVTDDALLLISCAMQ